MQLKKYLIVLPALLVVANCAKPEPETITVTRIEPKNIPIVSRPSPVNLVAPKFYVVTKDNYDQFIRDFRKANGTEAYIAISVKDYENLSINVGELKRYIEQQQKIIVYYENNLRK